MSIRVPQSFSFFHCRLFFCLRRSGFVIGVREIGFGARPNFLYAGKPLTSRIQDPPTGKRAAGEEGEDGAESIGPAPVLTRPRWLGGSKPPDAFEKRLVGKSAS
ncbi:hypothetical protein EYF80_065054 [Liparis tanakae]|uniref:Uncharacterized protein n=1 Tax=Liparis tanakae TaxID=230148 RepID=A0A4Z2E8C0_9TELE|nr:hypothetical protein EYF80_065054 [Liparis tanakae]